MVVRTGIPVMMSRVDARVDAWLWLFLNREGANLPLDSFMGPSMKRDMDDCIRSRYGSEWRVENHLWLLPEERLAWITEEERQINWLSSYIQQKLKRDRFLVPPRLFGRNLVIASLDIWSVDLDSKAGAVDLMEREWNQHKQADRIFTWFKEKDEVSRCELAWNWFVEKKSLSVWGKAPISSYEDLLIFFGTLPISEAEKKLNVDAIKKRWSQQQYRKKNTGKKQCNLLLSNKGIASLDKLAVKYGLSRSQVLDALIQFETERGTYLPEKIRASKLD